MIQVSIVSGELVARRASPLALQFTNVGRGPCTNIVFKLTLPAGVALMGGTDRVEIPAISAGRTHLHQVTVEAAQSGRFELTSSNFSYRDERHNPVRVRDFSAGFTVGAAASPVRFPQPTGKLGVTCEESEIQLGEWDQLRILVSNRTGVPLGDVTVAIEGAFTGDGKRVRAATLGMDATARFSFRVHATQSGRHVPVTVRTTYSHPGPDGTLRTVAQEDHLGMVVRGAAEPAADRQVAQQTILYLAASPQNLPPLRSDVEMREVDERLRLSAFRDRYRLVFKAATRFNDISQALMDHQPHLVHFSGHGDRDGNLIAEDRNGDGALLAPEGLARLFGRHRSTLRCVVLNSCYSARLAQAIATQVDYVVGVRSGLRDDAAIEFSVGFYIGLFGGNSVPDAFGRGEDHLLSHVAMAPGHATPVLFRRDH